MIKQHDNNFDFLRLIAASLVVFGHSFHLNGFYNASPLTLQTHGQTYEGGIGVFIFFAISGFLITQSYTRTNDIKKYIKARFLRIVPGITVVVLLSVFFLGPLVTKLSLKEYFGSVETWKYLENIIPVFVKFQLPGVSFYNPHGVNGSLWTIPLELRCYVIVAILGMICALKYRIVTLSMFLLVFAGYLGLVPVKIGSNVLFYLMFFSGSIFYLYRECIPHKWWIALFSFGVLYVANENKFILKAMPIFGTYLIIYLANLKTLPLYKVTKYGDLSYGVYIYAFPIQQSLIYINGEKMDPINNFAWAMPLSLLFAGLSWYFIEKPALSYKNKSMIDCLKRNNSLTTITKVTNVNAK